FEAVYGTIEEMVGRLATIEEGLRGGEHAPPASQSVDLLQWRSEPSATRIVSAPAVVPEAPTLVPSPPSMADSAATIAAVEAASAQSGLGSGPSGILPADPPATTARLREPHVSDLAPDAPLEPGSAALRVRAVANAIDRIAASVAVNGAAKPAETA